MVNNERAYFGQQFKFVCSRVQEKDQEASLPQTSYLILIPNRGTIPEIGNIPFAGAIPSGGGCLDFKVASC